MEKWGGQAPSGSRLIESPLGVGKAQGESKMTKPFGPLAPSHRLLLGPGPSQISPRVLRACATPLLGYLDPEFTELMAKTQELLRQVFETTNEWTFCAPGTGMAGMAVVWVNLPAGYGVLGSWDTPLSVQTSCSF